MAVPLVCFYGDDLTGSTDAMANFARRGLSVRLVLPSVLRERHLSSILRGTHILGVAGTARSLPTERLDEEVGPVFKVFRELGAPIVQYKICSTFDSSPQVGSIGRACELAFDIWRPRAIPVVPAQPSLGRWTVFGTHFALAPDGRVYRLDRHPVMSVHPVTPATEADLVLALRSQTALPVTSLHWPELASYPELAAQERGLVVLDARHNADLRRIGNVVRAAGDSPLVVVGSGGMSYALASTLLARGKGLHPRAHLAKRVLALSGTCAQSTARQIENAAAHGWVALDARESPGSLPKEACRVLQSGRSVVAYSALGNADQACDTAMIEAAFVETVVAAARESCLERLVIAGGDTAGRALSALGIVALEYVAEVDRGAVLCKATATRAELDGLEVVAKGGQVGSLDFFQRATGSRTRAT